MAQTDHEEPIEGSRTIDADTTALLDLDGFKQINDTHGHAAGDELRTTDLVARLGGDEFALLLQPVNVGASITDTLQRVHARIVSPASLANGEVAVGCSVGDSWYPFHGTDPQSLLQHADAAMYANKRARRSPPESQGVNDSSISDYHDRRLRAPPACVWRSRSLPSNSRQLMMTRIVPHE